MARPVLLSRDQDELIEYAQKHYNSLRTHPKSYVYGHAGTVDRTATHSRLLWHLLSGWPEIKVTGVCAKTPRLRKAHFDQVADDET